MVLPWIESLFEQAVKPLLAFANLVEPGPEKRKRDARSLISSGDQVIRLFAPLALASQLGRVDQPRLKVLRPNEVTPFVKDQARVRRLLAQLSNKQAGKRREAQAEIEALIGRTTTFLLSGSARFEGGVLALDVYPILDGIEACISFPLAMLADDAAERWHRIGRCAFKPCNQYFVRAAGDHRQRYCSPNHSQRERDSHRGRGRQHK